MGGGGAEGLDMTSCQQTGQAQNVAISLQVCQFMMGNVIFASSPRQMSPLHWAADNGHVNTVKFLVEKGAKVNSKDGTGVSE